MTNFSESIVNQRFREVFDQLEIKRTIKSKSDLAKQLGTYNHVIHSILKGQRNITVEQIQKLVDSYGINANFLFGLSDEVFLFGSNDFPTRSLSERKSTSRNNITLVPERALAGYATEHQDKDYLASLQKFSIPGMDGSLLAFEISGDSMMPTITNGDLVICEALERGAPLRDNHVYVIVTDVVVTKRIQQIKDEKGIASLRLISDNDAVYKPYNVELTDIRQLLKVKCRLTSYAIS